MKKKKIKSAISNYNELLVIKKELQKNITKQEKSLKNDILLAGNVFNIYQNFFSKKNKKNNIILNSPSAMILNELLIRLFEPFAKNKKQKQILIPIISSGISYIIVKKLNKKQNSLFKNNQSA